MTDHSALIERLDLSARLLTMGDQLEPGSGSVLLIEAAAALRDQQARLDRWEPKPFCQPSVSGGVFISRLFDGSVTLPSAPDQAKALK